MLSIHVGDVLLAGVGSKVAHHMEGLRSLVIMGKVQVVNKFLGTTYRLKSLVDRTHVTISQSAHAQVLLQRYKQATGIVGPLRKIDTPMIAEDVESQFGHLISGFGTQAKTHLGGLCSWSGLPVLTWQLQ